MVFERKGKKLKKAEKKKKKWKLKRLETGRRLKKKKTFERK